MNTKIIQVWNKDIFFEVCASLQTDCSVLELVCIQFCSYMAPNDFWVQLSKVCYDEMPIDLEQNARETFFSSFYHWDEELYLENTIESQRDLKFFDKRQTIEEITNQSVRWKFVKCQEPLPRTEGKFFCFTMDVIRCETLIAYVGFGISHFLDTRAYGTESYPHNCPWFWHQSARRVFRKGDQVGCVGCVKGGHYLLNFFINEKLFNGEEYIGYAMNRTRKCLKSRKEAYIHFAIVTGEKFTICRPKLGFQYYIKKFKESDVYNGRDIDNKKIGGF